MATNCYILLGLPHDATRDQIKQAFRRLSLKHHPDLASDRGSAGFLQIKEAYDTLMDAGRRSEHDRRLRPDRGSASDGRAAPAAWRPSGVREVTPTGGVRSGARGGSPPSNLDVNVEIRLTWTDATRGRFVPLELPVLRPCPRCNGGGGTGFFTCSVCGGRGKVAQSHRVEAPIPPGVRDGTVLSVPLRRLGLRGGELKLHIRVEG